MHEISLCRDVLDIIEQKSSVYHYKHVKKVHLEIGALANVEPSAFEFGFEIITKNTIAEGALLECTIISGRALCRDCDKTVLVYRWFSPCTECGSHQLTILSGEEISIKSLEVE